MTQSNVPDKHHYGAPKSEKSAAEIKTETVAAAAPSTSAQVTEKQPSRAKEVLPWPKMGDIVAYYEGPRIPSPAIVTHVNPDGALNLQVFTYNGATKPMIGVKHAVLTDKKRVGWQDLCEARLELEADMEKAAVAAARAPSSSPDGATS